MALVRRARAPSFRSLTKLVQVVAVMSCMIVIITKIDVAWDDAFLGFVPSKYIFQKGGVYICEFDLTRFVHQLMTCFSGRYRGRNRHAP